MRVVIWGARGSLPTPGLDTLRYGGNTSCVQVTLEDGKATGRVPGTLLRGPGARAA